MGEAAPIDDTMFRWWSKVLVDIALIEQQNADGESAIDICHATIVYTRIDWVLLKFVTFCC